MKVFDLGEALSRIASARPSLTLMGIFCEAAMRGGWYGKPADCPDKIMVDGLTKMVDTVNTIIEVEVTEQTEAEEVEPMAD